MTDIIVGRGLVAGLALLVCACVTVNVYFPAAAAESAADALVKEVYGLPGKEPRPAGEKPADDDSSALPLSPLKNLGWRVLDIVVPNAYAQAPQIDIDTPAVNTLAAAMRARHEQLQQHYQSGALGMANAGLLIVREPKAIGIRDRAAVNQLVTEENRDRNALYVEVARANGHPEWEPQIRAIFAQRWVANAPAGWWHQDATGGWQQK